MTDLYDSGDDGTTRQPDCCWPPPLGPEAPWQAHAARHETLLHSHHNEIASLRVGRSRLGNSVSRVEGQLSGLRQQLDSLRVEVHDLRSEVAELRPDVLRVRRLLAWGGGSSVVVLVVMEALSLLMGQR